MLSTCSVCLVWTSSSCQCSSLRNFVDFLLESFLRSSDSSCALVSVSTSGRFIIKGSRPFVFLGLPPLHLSLFIYTCAQRFAEGRTSTCDPAPGPYPYPLSALLERFGLCSEALPTWGSRWWPCLAQLCWSAANGMQPTWTGNYVIKFMPRSLFSFVQQQLCVIRMLRLFLSFVVPELLFCLILCDTSSARLVN